MKKIALIIIILLSAVLRLYKLDSFPPSLYWDEASLGYNAYSIMQTGKDEHGTFLPFTNFAAFGDYKPPGYIYLAVPAITLFDLSEFSIRFPSALAGVFTVFLTYLLTRKLFDKDNIGLLSAFFLAISPWHIQMSRAAFESNVALLFSTLGIYSFIKFATGKPIYIYLSAASFLIAMYTFTGQRLFVPLILLILVIQFRKAVLSNWKAVFLAALAATVLFWPLFSFATQTIEGRLRFNEVSIFNDQKPIEDSIKYRERNNFAWWSNILYNRRVFYAYEYLKHYFDAFNPKFLFVSGDVNPRLSIQETGELYYLDLVFIISGLYFLFREKNKYRYLITGWVLISAAGPAMARETPHALRMLHILPSYQIIAAFGMFCLYKRIAFKKQALLFLTLTLGISFAYYLHFYYFHYANDYSGQWQFGYKEAVEESNSLYNGVDKIFVTNSLGRPYIYFLLYTKFHPNEYLKSAKIVKDNFYFINVEGFDKYAFGDLENMSFPNGRNLVITNFGALPQGSEKIKTINEVNGKPILDIGIVKK